jgi:hypothetical protein
VSRGGIEAEKPRLQPGRDKTSRMFVPVVVLAGAVAAGERRASSNQAVAGVVALLSYLLATSAMFGELTSPLEA